MLKTNRSPYIAYEAKLGETTALRPLYNQLLHKEKANFVIAFLKCGCAATSCFSPALHAAH